MSEIKITIYTYREQLDQESVSIILMEEGISSSDDICADARGLTTVDFGLPDPEECGLWSWVDEGTDPIGFDFEWRGYWRRLTIGEIVNLSQGESESQSKPKLSIVPDSLEKE